VGVECLTLAGDDAIGDVIERAATISGDGRPVVVEVAIDYSRKTFFTRGVQQNGDQLKRPELRTLSVAIRSRFVPESSISTTSSSFSIKSKGHFGNDHHWASGRQ
jgi:hypothetical protein